MLAMVFWVVETQAIFIYFCFPPLHFFWGGGWVCFMFLIRRTKIEWEIKWWKIEMNVALINIRTHIHLGTQGLFGHCCTWEKEICHFLIHTTVILNSVLVVISFFKNIVKYFKWWVCSNRELNNKHVSIFLCIFVTISNKIVILNINNKWLSVLVNIPLVQVRETSNWLEPEN